MGFAHIYESTVPVPADSADSKNFEVDGLKVLVAG